MKRLPVILRKEFIQIFRNKAMLPIIFVIPIVQLLILVNAADFEIKNIRLDIVDMDKSAKSRELIAKFDHSPYFNIRFVPNDFKENIKELDNGNSDVLMRIKEGFSEDLHKGQSSAVMFDVNGID